MFATSSTAISACDAFSACLCVQCTSAVIPVSAAFSNLCGNSDGTPQRAAQAAHIAQLEETIVGLQAQHQQVQGQLAEKARLDQSGMQALTSAKEQGAKAEEHIKELQKVLEDQNKELVVLQV